MTERFDCCGKEYSISELKRSVIDAKGVYSRFCTSCVSGNPGVPDVFIGSTSGDVMYEENIADKNGDPIPFYDKTSKRAAMKQAGVREAGDRIHGERITHGERKTYFT